jgi:hypothetical protein
MVSDSELPGGLDSKILHVFKGYSLVIFSICMPHETITTIKIVSQLISHSLCAQCSLFLFHTAPPFFYKPRLY